ncbi:dynamin family protein [Geodermatophilus sp. DSM 45219]|uniref:dynamin family protein n=1 Tax=Geodermatophilus sp. DSM 45219 TaxID=1881103 RepID=UPI00087E4533|nr:dynamin family protein [Geodermatophilus sp. DSM 45219]SDO05507.1 Dynamin family protein [Geodermatophilus sp. DSM 45219]
MTELDDVRALLDEALARYQDVPAVADRLAAQRRRLDEPLRLALVGRVKSGKSTLLNALVGARVAPTDAGECTRVVTHYRHGATPRVELHGTDGGRRTLPVRRADGGLRLELGGTPPEEVAQLVVDWPADDLRPATVVDTPGIASLSTGTSTRTREFLGTDQGPAGADAVVFLTRQPQPEDVAVLAAFQAGTGGAGALTTTITVLSRADEVGAGRLDALAAAESVARRMSADPQVRAVSSAVLPVAGLLALAGRTLRHGDFVALRTLASADQQQVSRMLLTADRFTRADAPVPLSVEVRAALLDRLGLFGIRLSVALVRTGVPDASALADELLARSGLAELQRLLRVQFTERGTQLRAGTALRLLADVLDEHPLPADDDLRADLERLRLATPDLAELDLLARSRAAAGPLPEHLRAEAEGLLGAAGTGPAARLGLPEGTPDGQLRRAALDALARWRDAADDPLAWRATADAAEVVVRACERLLAGLDRSAAEGPGRAAQQRDGGDHEQPGGGYERPPVEVGAPGDDGLGDVEREHGRHRGEQQRPARPAAPA